MGEGLLWDAEDQSPDADLAKSDVSDGLLVLTSPVR